jgi:hypothetical protein
MKQTRNTEEIITEMNLLFIKMDLLIKRLQQFKTQPKEANHANLPLLHQVNQ